MALPVTFVPGDILEASQLNSNFTYVEGLGGLTHIATATPTAVQSISINDCFSATYQNYLILANFTAAVGANAAITMRLRVSGTDATTNYNWQLMQAVSSSAVPTAGSSLATSSFNVGEIDASSLVCNAQITAFNPFATSKTFINVNGQSQLSTARYDTKIITGFHSDATSYDGFTIITSGTSVTGIIRVYGYANS